MSREDAQGCEGLSHARGVKKRKDPVQGFSAFLALQGPSFFPSKRLSTKNSRELQEDDTCVDLTFSSLKECQKAQGFKVYGLEFER